MTSKELKSLLRNTGTSRAEWHEMCKSFNSWKQTKELPWLEGLTAGQLFADSMLTSACVSGQWRYAGEWDTLCEEFYMGIGHAVGYPDKMNEYLSFDDFARYCYLCGVRDALNN